MSKTNYTKVEKVLDEGLLKITVEHLLEEADTVSPSKAKPSKLLPDQEKRIVVIQKMDQDLKKISKSDPSIYKKIGFTRRSLKAFLNHPELLKPEDWKKIKEVKERIEAYKRELAKKLPHNSDEEIVNDQRIKHINKRFNTQDSWLPLH